MTNAFDHRQITLTLTYNGQTKTYDQGFNILARGRKYTDAIMNECEVLISNIDAQTRHDILTLTSPNQQKNLTPVQLALDVGRESTGVFRLFQGDVIASGVTQPPDISILLKSLTNSYFQAKVAGYTQAPVAQLSQIASQIAKANNLTLDNQATDKQVSNFSFTGSTAKLIDKLNDLGGIKAFVDNNTLVIVNASTPRKGEIRLINKDNGMVGVPEVFYQGCRVKVMVDNSIQLFGQVQVDSLIQPAANGTYIVSRLDFEISSREQPFWYILECYNPAFWFGGTQG